MAPTMRRAFFLLFLFLLAGCSKGSSPEAQAPAQKPGDIPPVAQRASIPYLDELLPPEERDLLGEKYRPIFTNENILQALTFDGLTPFPRWEKELQKKFLQTLVFLEKNQGAAIPSFDGACRNGENLDGCFAMRDFKVAIMDFDPDYADYLKGTHWAWNLYVEANGLVPWSLLNYSLENLKILFYTSLSQPKLASQHFAATIDVIEDYQILRGKIREAGDSLQDLVGASALETVLNILEFVGERVTHFTGSANNNMGPSSAIWPYRAADDTPLNRLPTPKEILVYRDPHHDLIRRPEGIHGPQFHIVNGCWGTSKLLQSLLASVNIPVRLQGDYLNFGGHSGVKFAEVEGHEYYLHHSDDLYHFPWTYGILKAKESLTGSEKWNGGNFAPFSSISAGYSVLHTDKAPLINHQKILNALGVPPEKVNLFEAQLGADFGDYDDFDGRVLALRAVANPSAQNLYTRCVEPGLERRHLPLEFLTDEEEAMMIQTMDLILIAKRLARLFDRPSCMELFFRELNDLYKKKTGLDLKGDEDGDGFENHRDCRVYAPDGDPCEDAFRESLGIINVG